jgi:Fe-S cluster assembly protein SufB
MSKYTEDDLKELATKEYEYGFYTELEADTFPIGLNEDIVRAISHRKKAAMDDRWRESFRAWQQMTEPGGQMCIMQNLIFRLFLIIQLQKR